MYVQFAFSQNWKTGYTTETNLTPPFPYQITQNLNTLYICTQNKAIKAEIEVQAEASVPMK